MGKDSDLLQNLSFSYFKWCVCVRVCEFITRKQKASTDWKPVNTVHNHSISHGIKGNE